jgi:hypothetical protein
MVVTSLTANLSALTFQAALADPDPINTDELKLLKDYLRSLELEMKVESRQRTFSWFFESPS